MANKTQINKNLTGSETVINQNLQPNNATVINSQVANSSMLPKGTVLCKDYKVLSKLDVQTGEADLYICSKEEQKYVAKIYRRAVSVKPEVSRAIKKLDSPYVAKIFTTGEYQGYLVEIQPYYRCGSLVGRKFTYQQLKKYIIPCLNEGLKVLHDNGIIHKDLKPSNIMIADNRKDVAIIDFGISSVREGDSTVVVTKTGMTPEYSAPETYKNLVLIESDYYSFGITLYELFCGKTPYTNMSQEEIEKYALVQHIPFPEDMPDDLKDLIKALTYNDITNRRDKTNPNRRWGYEEVLNWCNGIKQTIPGEGFSSKDIKPYVFMGKNYVDKTALVNALIEHWDNGKKELFRGKLSEYFKVFDKDAEKICREAELEATRINGKDDLIFWKTMYELDKKLNDFFWKGKRYTGLPDFGRDVLEHLWKEDSSLDRFVDSVFCEGILSQYVILMDAKNERKIEAIKGLESSYRAYRINPRDQQMSFYMMAYMLSGQKLMRVDNKEFRTIGELTNYMKELLAVSFESFQEFCHGLIDYDEKLNPQFESWLIALGKREAISTWRATIREVNHDTV